MIGLHFFNPVWAMPLLEIVVGASTPPGAVETARAVAARLGKDPVVVRDRPGFARERDGGLLTALQCAAGSRLPKVKNVEAAKLLLHQGMGSNDEEVRRASFDARQ